MKKNNLTSIKSKIPNMFFPELVWKSFPEAKIYLVGGAVRDLILGRKEILDWDFVVTKAPIEKLIPVLERIGKVNLVGRHFGVIKFTPFDWRLKNYPIDIALPRREKSKDFLGKRTSFVVDSDSDLPIEDDLSRRDFTINAMAFDLKEEKLIDLFGGLKDLAGGKIRSVRDPEERFAEDYSRIVRGIRFACQLDFSIELKTKKAMMKMGKFLGNREAISEEIIASEFGKMLVADSKQALALLMNLKILEIIFPELESKLESNFIFNGHEFSKAKMLDKFWKLLDKSEAKESYGVASVLYLSLAFIFIVAGLSRHGFKDAGQIAGEFSKRHRISSINYAEISSEKLVWLVESANWIILNKGKYRLADIERIFFSNFFPSRDLEILLSLLSKMGGPFSEITEAFGDIQELIKKMPINNDRLPKRLLDGHFLFDVLHVPEGAKIGFYLEKLREEQLSGRIKTKDEAINFLKLLIAA